MPISLLDLPSELVIVILLMLPLPSLAACQCTNRPLYTLIKESTILQYIIETQANGVEDFSPSNFSLPVRLDRLKAWSRSWLSFGFTHKATIAARLDLAGLSWLHDLADGIFLHSDKSSNPASRPNSTSLMYASLAPLPVVGIQWSTIPVGREIIGWATLPRNCDMIALTTLLVNTQPII
jgi:hypothetical protein